MVFNETRELNHDLISFRQEIRAIQQRLGEADATLALVDIDQLEEAEMKIWKKYKDSFAQVEKNLNNEDELANVQKQSVGPLSDEIVGMTRMMRVLPQEELDQKPAQFYGWLANRMMALMYPAEESIQEEKSHIFG